MTDVGYGLAAGLGFGFLFIALDQAGTDAGAWPLLPGQLVALVLVTVAALPQIDHLRHRQQALKINAVVRWGGAAGLLGACANLLFLFASGAGQLTITAVLAGLYPAVTVTLAAIVLHERINRTQRSGLLAAATSIVLIITGA
jgi:drug/metabolite transporter (DMT)-like permease